MRYFATSLSLSLRARLRGRRFWLLLLLIVTTGLLLRWTTRPSPSDVPVRVGLVLPADAAPFEEALTRRGGASAAFIPADEPTARSRVAASQWDCALLLPEDFTARLEASDLDGIVTLLTGPGSTVYPLVRETAAAALLELTTAQIAADYLRSSGIAPDASAEALPLPPTQHVRIEMETLTGRPLDELGLAEESASRVFRGSIAAALLVWTLFTAVDLGRWQESGAARRMRPILGTVLLTLPRLLAAMLPAFLLGAAGLLACGGWTGSFCLPALALYLAALGALALLLSSVRPAWTALPAVIPFAAVSVFVLSPVFVDMTLYFPRLKPLSRWLPATLYLQGCEGDLPALARLLLLTAVLTAAALLPERLRRRKSA